MIYLGALLVISLPVGLVATAVMLPTGVALSRKHGGFPTWLSRATGVTVLLTAASFVGMLIYFQALGCHLDTGCG